MRRNMTERLGEIMTNQYGSFQIVEYNNARDIVVKRDDGVLIHSNYTNFTRKQIKGTNKYELFNDYGICYALNTREPILFDIEFYDKIKQYTWSVYHIAYGYYGVFTHINNKRIPMQNYIFDTTYLDHINGNTLDNRRCNLRPSIDSNGYNRNSLNTKKRFDNTSGHKGVLYEPKYQYSDKKWLGKVEYKKHRYTKRFNTFEDACKWVDNKRKELHGEFTNNG